MKMNCYTKFVVGYHGVTGTILCEPVERLSPDDVGYRYELEFSYKYGFSCTRRLKRGTSFGYDPEEELVTFSSFVDPFNPTEDEMMLVKFLTKYYTEVDEVVIALCGEVLQYVLNGEEEFQMEELARLRLKVLEE